MLCAERLECGYLLSSVAGCGWAGERVDLGEDLQAHVAMGFGPFVVLLHQDRADEPDDGVAVGEDADHVGAPAQFAVEPLLVGSARGAVSALRLVRFRGPPAEPDVRVPTHPALHVPVSVGYAAVVVDQGVGMLPR
jgi:hypothetical protein